MSEEEDRRTRGIEEKVEANSGYESFDGGKDKVEETKECAAPRFLSAQNWKQLSNFRGNGGEKKKRGRKKEKKGIGGRRGKKRKRGKKQETAEREGKGEVKEDRSGRRIGRWDTGLAVRRPGNSDFLSRVFERFDKR